MTAPIEDVTGLPGKKLVDQAGNAIGKVKQIYAMRDGPPMWVAVDASNAALVPEEGGAAQRVDDPARLSTPDAGTRSEETMERLQDPGGSETRKVTASDVVHDDQDVAAGD
ncbi:MAG TPA: hypothetical protein VMJ65_11550 [Solirubrobacteraceae bacterium]|nr:hypothetical protein [Solirubrobacteraceae bacterium]